MTSPVKKYQLCLSVVPVKGGIVDVDNRSYSIVSIGRGFNKRSAISMVGTTIDFFKDYEIIVQETGWTDLEKRNTETNDLSNKLNNLIVDFLKTSIGYVLFISIFLLYVFTAIYIVQILN